MAKNDDNDDGVVGGATFDGDDSSTDSGDENIIK